MTTEDITKHIAAYCATRPEIVACYLYGSRATGKERPDSDVDVAFLLDGEIVRTEYFRLKETFYCDLSRLLRLTIHPLVMNDAGEIVLEQVFRKGKAVYGGASLECARFRMIQSALIAEFAPVRGRMEEALFRKYREVTAHG